MEKRFIDFGSIAQFRNIIRDIQHATRYIGKDEDGEATFDSLIELPKVIAIASEKVHGTNLGICYDHKNGFWIQSRKNIITSAKDNAGAAFAAEQNETEWRKIIFQLAQHHNIDLNENTISVFAEWAGGNIQKNSALSNTDKKAMIFQYFKITPHATKIVEKAEGPEEVRLPSYWLQTTIYEDFGVPHPDINWASNPGKNIFNVMDYGVTAIEIDFERPDIFQEKIVKMIEENEKASPMGKRFGENENILEGYVVTFKFKDDVYRFKAKGELHAVNSGRVKAIKAVDVERENLKIQFVNDHGCTNMRLQQMYDEVFDTLNGGKGDRRKTGDLIAAVMKDIIKEESDILTEMGLEPKAVNGLVAKQVNKFLASKLSEEVGL